MDRVTYHHGKPFRSPLQASLTKARKAAEKVLERAQRYRDPSWAQQALARATEREQDRIDRDRRIREELDRAVVFIRFGHWQGGRS